MALQYPGGMTAVPLAAAGLEITRMVFGGAPRAGHNTDASHC